MFFTIQFMPPPSIPTPSPCSSLHPVIPPLLPSLPLIDYPDADREQRAAGVPAGWGGSWPWVRRAWWRRRRRRTLARGRKSSRRRRLSWTRNGLPIALCALLNRLSLPPPLEGAPGFFNVRARSRSWPHSPWPPSPGLPGSSPAAPQHT